MKRTGKHSGRLGKREVSKTIVWLLTVLVLILIAAIPGQWIHDYLYARGGEWGLLFQPIAFLLVILILLSTRSVMWLLYRNEDKA